MSAQCSGKIRSVNLLWQNCCTWTYYFHKPACVHLIHVFYMCVVNRIFRVCTCPWTIFLCICLHCHSLRSFLFCSAVINLCSIKLYHNFICFLNSTSTDHLMYRYVSLTLKGNDIETVLESNNMVNRGYTLYNVLNYTLPLTTFLWFLPFSKLERFSVIGGGWFVAKLLAIRGYIYACFSL